MKNIIFTLLLASSCFISCSKEENKPVGNTTMKGDLRVTVRLYNDVGQPGVSALVNIALSQDSLNKGQYVKSMNADDFGYALFTNINWLNTTKHAIYINAEQTDGGKLLKGTAEASLIADRTTNAQVVVK